MPVMFSSQGVVKGPLEAFESQLQDSETCTPCFTCSALRVLDSRRGGLG